VSDGAERGGALRAWRFRVARRRLLRQGRLLLLVLAVAVLASTAVTSVGLLITATEQSAIRTSLAAVPASQTAISVDVEQPKSSLAVTTSRVNAAVRSVLRTTAHASPSLRAYTAPATTPTAGDPTSVAYLGQLSGISGHITVVHGTLPTGRPRAGMLEVAVPAVAATQLGLMVGSTLAYSGGTSPVTLRVVATYTARDPQAEYWSQDPLQAEGYTPGYLPPDGAELTAVKAFGPLLVSAGSIDGIGQLSDRVEFDYAPSFATMSASQLQPLINRLGDADSNIPSDIGDIAQQVSYSGTGNVPLAQIAAALVVTSATVVVVTLLLLVLGVAALGQAARLFNDARAGDRELLRARGASGGQLLGIAVLEAGVVGVITAALSAPLSRLVYAIVAKQPAMVAARVPSDSGLPLSAWATSIGLGALFVAVLLVSLLGRSGTFVSAEQTRSRGRRVSGLLRSGLDLGVVVLAVVAFWQLEIYRSPVGATSTPSVDPVLVSAPALVLLAGSLLAARLFPLLARLIDWLGSRSSGVLFRLASWEIGRRSQRATAVVLLLTLALAVGTFSQTFLATWQQSQVDQADYAVGPSVRVPAAAGQGGAQRSVLEHGAEGTPQPVIRRIADTGQDDSDGEDTDAVVLGLTSGARAMLNHGELAADGGSLIATRLKGSAQPARGIRLPGNPVGISAVAQIGDASAPLPGIVADVTAIVQDGAGLLTTVDLGDIPMDGAPHSVSGMLPTLTSGTARALPLEVVGVQTSVFLGNQATYRPNAPLETHFLVRSVAALGRAVGSHQATTIAAPGNSPLAWNANSSDNPGAGAQEITVPGWQVALGVIVPGNVQDNPGFYSATAWPSADEIPAVISTSVAHALDAKVGSTLDINFSLADVTIQIVGVTPLIPGTVDNSLLTASAAAGADAAKAFAVVVDQTALERALVQGGESGSMVDEWWVNVPAPKVAAYLAAHRGARSRAELALQMQQDPLRVATQAALWLAIAVAAVLAAIGFAVHSASTLAARRIELAQLRAIGLSRRSLVRLIGTESILLCALGVLFGVIVGLVLGWLAGPLIALSPNGMPAVPTVRVIVPWLQLVVLVLVVVVVLVAVVGAVARGQRSANPANILREADNG